VRRGVIAAVVLAGVVAGLAAAQAASRWVERTKADVRAGRGSYYEVVDTVLKGEQVRILQGAERWLLVQTPREKKGWIFAAALGEQPVTRGMSDFLRLVPGDASTSATAASTGAKGVYAQGYAEKRGYDYNVVRWIEESQPAAAEIEAFVREGELKSPGGGS